MKPYLVAACLIIAGAAAAQDDPLIGQVLHMCVPPLDPIADAAVLELYDMTLVGEFSRYFDEAQSYIICLERSRDDWIAHLREKVELFRQLQGTD